MKESWRQQKLRDQRQTRAGAQRAEHLKNSLDHLPSILHRQLFDRGPFAFVFHTAHGPHRYVALVSINGQWLNPIQDSLDEQRDQQFPMPSSPSRHN